MAIIDTNIIETTHASNSNYVASIVHQSTVQTSRGHVHLSGNVELNPPNGETYEQISEDPAIASAMVIAWIKTFEEYL